MEILFHNQLKNKSGLPEIFNCNVKLRGQNDSLADF